MMASANVTIGLLPPSFSLFIKRFKHHLLLSNMATLNDDYHLKLSATEGNKTKKKQKTNVQPFAQWRVCVCAYISVCSVIAAIATHLEIDHFDQLNENNQEEVTVNEIEGT
ncbi:MAG: hypothetical protein QRY16_21345 [Enterobacterales bacterium endosymbiont of Blomia tropicalis]|uniref:hypothetical protein n=1 Tax=Mixta mediterraneensis TaxID=2758443 RepID=UPI0025A6C464|nr:hypothetical protein [Mixta mediterraneensis]MDL4916212.1 hypothetical protein [Mixta mediterraneensis]